jgi:hypothetical protein
MGGKLRLLFWSIAALLTVAGFASAAAETPEAAALQQTVLAICAARNHEAILMTTCGTVCWKTSCRITNGKNSAVILRLLAALVSLPRQRWPKDRYFLKPVKNHVAITIIAPTGPMIALLRNAARSRHRLG